MRSLTGFAGYLSCASAVLEPGAGTTDTRETNAKGANHRTMAISVVRGEYNDKHANATLNGDCTASRRRPSAALQRVPQCPICPCSKSRAKDRLHESTLVGCPCATSYCAWHGYVGARHLGASSSYQSDGEWPAGHRHPSGRLRQCQTRL